MQAQTLQCFSCGAPARTDDPTCQHCSARLATVACPGCFGMMFLGSRFCPHCGGRGDRWDQGQGTLDCPGCGKHMFHTRVGQVDLQECAGCHGLWLDAGSVEQVFRAAETQSAVLHRYPGSAGAAPAFAETVRYRRCPVCRELMNRRNIARSSGVVVDVCKGHGTWFDEDELNRVVGFIRDGGLERARRAEVEELEERKRRLQMPAPSGGVSLPPITPGTGGGWGLDLDAGSLLEGVVRVAWHVLSD